MNPGSPTLPNGRYELGTVGILEIINPDNYHRFRKYLPALREMAGKRKAEFGEDGIWTHIYLTIEELESYEPPAS